MNVYHFRMFVIYECSWFANVCDIQMFVIYEHSMFTHIRDKRMFVVYKRSWLTYFLTLMNFQCSWFTNIFASRTTRRSWTAWCVKPLRISVDSAAFMFRVVICPTNMRSSKVDNQENKAGYTANTICGRVGRGGNARFSTRAHGRTDGPTDGPTDQQTDRQRLL